MITFKQLESFVTLADAGTFEQAARSLTIAQSAVSRHISEFESHFSHDLLDRSGRRALLTLDGADVLTQCRAILQDRDAMLQVLRRETQPIQHFRLGVTEISALTWLPCFLESLHREFPEVKAETRVEPNGDLYRLLESDDLDVIVVPDGTNPVPFNKIWMGSMETNWYCSTRIHPGPRGLSLRELSDVTLLTKGADTRSGAALNEWLQSNSISPRVAISCNSTTKWLDLLAAGVGMACLPIALAEELLAEHKIVRVRLEPKVPAVNYVMLTYQGSVPTWKRNVIALAKRLCNFNKRHLAASPSLPNQIVQDV